MCAAAPVTPAFYDVVRSLPQDYELSPENEAAAWAPEIPPCLAAPDAEGITHELPPMETFEDEVAEGADVPLDLEAADSPEVVDPLGPLEVVDPLGPLEVVDPLGPLEGWGAEAVVVAEEEVVAVVLGVVPGAGGLDAVVVAEEEIVPGVGGAVASAAVVQKTAQVLPDPAASVTAAHESRCCCCMETNGSRT